MSMETNKGRNGIRLRKGYASIALAQDRALARDYRDLLLAQGIKVEIIKWRQEVDHEEFDYFIAVREDDVEQAIELVLSRNPSEYFFDTLFNSENKEPDLDEQF